MEEGSSSTAGPGGVGGSIESQYVSYLEVLATRWSSAAATSMIDGDLLRYLQPRFHRCSTPIKVRVLLSFLYLKERVRVENRELLLSILSEAEVDRDEWVKKLSRLVSSFVAVGAIDVRETDSETAYHLLKFLNAQREKHGLVYLTKPPLEAPHLANVLNEKLMAAGGAAGSGGGGGGGESGSGAAAPPPTGQELLFADFVGSSRVVTETHHFTPKIDFLAYNAELMSRGDQALRRAYKRHHGE